MSSNTVSSPPVVPNNQLLKSDKFKGGYYTLTGEQITNITVFFEGDNKPDGTSFRVDPSTSNIIEKDQFDALFTSE